MLKSITFILSGSGAQPCGGFKIVYEYATRLSNRGWKVNIVHPYILWAIEFSAPQKIKKTLSYLHKKILKKYLPNSWFKMDSKVNMLWVPNLNAKHIPDAEYIVACPVESSFFVANYQSTKGKKFYFIQHFEDWNRTKDFVEESWKLPLTKIVIAKWLAEIGLKLGQKTIYIPNGLDFSFFSKTTPYSDRKQYSILFLGHEFEWKGTQYAVDAVKTIKEKYPNLSVSSFGIYPRPTYYPDWIEYHQNPSQKLLKELYNSHRIFVSPSLAEGWPLPPAEALMCGAVLIATDIGGHREYADDNVNALICKPASSDAIAEKIEYVFKNPSIGETLSNAGPDSLKRFDWDSRVTLFEEALLTQKA